jgi:GNAT superfamily N-acetyltransferase
MRLLTASDIPQVMRLSQAAGWNQTADDWRRLLELEPEGCFGIEREGRVVATTTAVCYGRELAWIGMVLTDPQYRGQGLASSLMAATLEFLDGRHVQWVKLDATDMGKDLYRKFGFVDECPVERWSRSGAAPGAANLVAQKVGPPYPSRQEMDLRAFGADRNKLLASLAAGESMSIPGAGYAMGRPGSNAAYFGPCVADASATAQAFVDWFLSRHSGESVYWDLLPENRDAARLAERFGFRCARQLVRMARGIGRPAPPNVQQIYALAGFEFG